MSEPLTSHEIEDVLSSIRRLVSEDLRPAAARASGEAAPAAAAPNVSPAPARPAADGKLLLTPSLRVVPPAAPADPAPADAAGQGADPAPSAAEVEPAAAETAPETAPDRPAEPLVLTASPASSGYDEEEDTLWAAPGDPAPETAFSAPAEDDPERPAAADAPRGHWSAETVPIPEMDWMQAEADWTEDEDGDPLPFVAHPRAGLTQDPLARAWADRAEADVRAGLQETVTIPPEPPHADASGGGGGRMGGGNSGGGGHSGNSGGGNSGGGNSGGGADGPGLFDPEDPMIDEETLRDIVRDIIREELAGTLGERITRNVRKLVRVEINRALTAREFE